MDNQLKLSGLWLLPTRHFSFQVYAPRENVLRTLHLLSDGKVKNKRRWIKVQKLSKRYSRFDFVIETELNMGNYAFNRLTAGLNLIQNENSKTHISGSIWIDAISVWMLILSSMVASILLFQSIGTDHQWIFGFLLASALLFYHVAIIQREQSIRYIHENFDTNT